MNELALFAGVGGGLLATKWLLGWRTVCYVEKDLYRVKVLRARIRDGLLDDAPIWGDARTFDGRPWRGCVDIITAGFPCQPFSIAGKMEAEKDDRNLWPDTIRIINEVQSEWCLLENPTGLLSGSHGYFGQILGDLAESGYNARWRVLSAAELGAPHKRDRVWIVAHSNEKRLALPELWGASHRAEGDAIPAPESLLFSAWPPRPSKVARISRMADGVPDWVDRLAAIGDGQVPAVVETVWKMMVPRTANKGTQRRRIR